MWNTLYFLAIAGAIAVVVLTTIFIARKIVDFVTKKHHK